MSEKIKASIVGANGYTGAELLRLLGYPAAIVSVPLWIWIGYMFASNKALLLVISHNFKLFIHMLMCCMRLVGKKKGAWLKKYCHT